jgi:hypothetical protein
MDEEYRTPDGYPPVFLRIVVASSSSCRWQKQIDILHWMVLSNVSSVWNSFPLPSSAAAAAAAAAVWTSISFTPSSCSVVAIIIVYINLLGQITQLNKVFRLPPPTT